MSRIFLTGSTDELSLAAARTRGWHTRRHP